MKELKLRFRFKNREGFDVYSIDGVYTKRVMNACQDRTQAPNWGWLNVPEEQLAEVRAKGLRFKNEPEVGQSIEDFIITVEEWPIEVRHKYMILDRLKSDCEYFLNYGKGSTRYLVGQNVFGHILEMQTIWSELPVKPEWLTPEQIEDYSERMTNYKP